MVSSIIAWFVKSEDLTNEVKAALKGQNISNVSKHIDEKVDEIFNNRSTWFVDAKKQAIKSTLREIVDESKTIAIAKLLRDGKGTATEVAKAKEIAKELGYSKVLSRAEIAVIRENDYQSTIVKLIEEHQVVNNEEISPSKNASKAVNKALNKEVVKFESSFLTFSKEKQHELTKKVRDYMVTNFLSYHNISDSSEQKIIDDTVNDIFETIRRENGPMYNNPTRSSGFNNSATKQAIKSTFKEVVRETKTVAIAQLLDACNKSKEIKQLRDRQALMKEIVAEAKKIAQQLPCDKLLSEEKFKVDTVLSDDEIKYIVTHNENIIGNKKVNEEVEGKILSIILKTN